MRIKHEVGDRVRVIDEGSFYFDKVGIVSHFNEDLYYNVYVRFSGNDKCNFRHKELAKEEE